MPFKSQVVIDGAVIGKYCEPYIIAEVSGNHGGDFERATQLIRAAAKAGASAVKLQTYTADTMTLDCDRPEFMINDPSSLWNGRSLYDLYKEASTPWEWHAELFSLAREEGITIFSSPFDITAVDFLDKLDVPCFKISSFECTDLRLLQAVAKTGKPVILSTGTASLSEIAKSVETLEEFGCTQLILLICASLYPAPVESMRLERITRLANLFNIPVGLSDHSLGLTIPIAAIGAGASVIEKHFTLDDGVKTVDSDFSITSSELIVLCKEARHASIALGDGAYSWESSDESARRYRRSLYFSNNINEGDVISADDIKAVRPGFGLKTMHFDTVIGMVATKNIKYGTPVAWGLLKANSVDDDN